MWIAAELDESMTVGGLVCKLAIKMDLIELMPTETTVTLLILTCFELSLQLR